MGWKQIHFSLHLKSISVATQRSKNGPLGTQSYSEPCAFSPDPVLLVVGPWVTQSLSCSYFLCNTNSAAVPKSDRWTKRMFSHLERQRICCLTLVDSDSLLVIWCTSIYWIFLFCFVFLLIFHFGFGWFSKQFNQTWVNFCSVQVQRKLLWDIAHN